MTTFTAVLTSILSLTTSPNRGTDCAAATPRQARWSQTPVPASSWQYGVGEIVTAVIGAGLVLETLREYPYSNGYRPNANFIMDDARRWHWPPGFGRFPMMFGLAAHKP